MGGKKNIVILGGGFAGVRAALDLARDRQLIDTHRIVLIDRETYHLFTPWLYTRASTGAPRRGVRIPFQVIFATQPVEVIRGEVKAIHRGMHAVTLKGGQEIDYEYLIVALGSVSNDFGIDGIAKHALFLKTFEDAERIRSKIEKQYRAFAVSNQVGELFQVIIGGGGLTGVELVAELHSYLKDLARKYERGRGSFIIKIVEAEQRLLPGLPEWVSNKTHARLGSYRHVEILLQSMIAKVRTRKIELKNGDTLEYEILIWTAGVQAHPLIASLEQPLDYHKRVIVKSSLELRDDSHVYVIGDAGVVSVRTKIRDTETILNAYKKGEVAAANIVRALTRKPGLSYQPVNPGCIIPLSGAWAISTIGTPLIGRVAYLFLRLIHLRYFLHILPFSEAFKRWYGSG
ncbi:NAD(P)/FAD-dependent oxidoreductase [Candidatus Berkelbacteria bacterium]|nr:NAD(P)/FAD-dependent oxidoreductase [Candidatus Berkelbacteria bacterium]